MMKVIKKLTIVMMAVVIMLNFFSTNVYAGTDKPGKNKIWDISSDGKYSGSGLAGTSDLYSNYYFTGVTKMKISVTNNSSKNKLKVKVFKKGAIFSSSSVTVPASGTTTWTISTDSSTKYYLEFLAPCDFSWYIKKG